MTLSILVVEDDAEKLRRILAGIGQVPGIDVNSIQNARDCISAKRLMRNTTYDLVVLDISLPELPNQRPSADGGLKLLAEVLERDLYRRPREVVGLTAFPDVRDLAIPQFAEDLWQVLQYDASSTSWSEQLGRKVRHLLLASRPDVQVADFDLHLCVQTALASPELEAVLRLPWGWKAIDQGMDGTIYYRGQFKRGDETREVVAATAPRMGMAAAAALSAKMIGTFRPRYLAMVGISAGIKAECELGDIILADPVWDWGSGKLAVSKGVSTFHQAPHQISTSNFIRGKAVQMARDAAVLDEIKRSWTGDKPPHSLRMHVGPMASGAAVLADRKVVREIKTQHRKLTGIDMETYGVYSAAEEAPLPQPRAFALKAVTDFADANKNDDYQSYAAHTSASALRIFVERFL